MHTHSEENLLLNPDFIDILSAFSEEEVEYMVVGGYALAFHGYGKEQTGATLPGWKMIK